MGGMCECVYVCIDAGLEECIENTIYCTQTYCKQKFECGGVDDEPISFKKHPSYSLNILENCDIFFGMSVLVYICYLNYINTNLFFLKNQ